MNKDVIYIDVDDDITAIIGKIKASKEKIIALVPPKRIGVLQSAVNLRLLDRMAKTSKKHLVIISNNQALIALTASAHIPTARNLQSKPEIAEIPALSVDDDDDIIDGAELPISDHIKSAGQDDSEIVDSKKQTRDQAVETLAIDGEVVDTGEEGDATEASMGAKAIKSAAAKKDKVKIPNFSAFRKKLFLIIFGVVGLTALFIWMFIFAPAATITITASTSPSPVSTSIILAGSAATDYEEGKVKSIQQELKKNETVQFDATGEKQVGEKAIGTLEVSRLNESEYTLPAGSRFETSSGLGFITNADVIIPASVACFPTFCAQSAEVDVTAESAGENYNGAFGTLTGPDNTTGEFTENPSGGTTEVVKVVTAEDIERAKGDMVGKSTDTQKTELKTQFDEDTIVIDNSFTVSRGNATSSPVLGKEVADGKKATLTVPVTYTMHGIAKAELETYLTANLSDRLSDTNNQRVYDTGIDTAQLSGYKKGTNNVITATLTATGQIGPKIDESSVKDMVKGKITGDVQSTLESIDGIKDVSVKYSYFWVRTVPSDENKIRLEFKLEENDS